MTKYLTLLALISLSFTSCSWFADENETVPCDDEDNEAVPVVLIEEFTGHKCGNCPKADAKMKFIKEEYCNQVVYVQIHSGYFAEPDESGLYTIDYTTMEGDSLFEKYKAGEVGLPNAMVNRKKFYGDLVLPPTHWEEAVNNALPQEAFCRIHQDVSLSASTRTINLDLEFTFFQPTNDSLIYNVYLVEDSLLSWQKDYITEPEDKQDYPHRFVLRAAPLGYEGAFLHKGVLLNGDILHQQFRFSFKEEYATEQLYIISFVGNAETGELLQSNMVSLLK